MQRFSHTSSILLSIASLTLSTTALAQHADVWVSSANGSLYTGGWDHVTGEVINPVQRVFEGELGLDPAFPFSGDEPGIGSNLVGLSLTMNLLQGLSAWNGTDFVTSTYSLGAYFNRAKCAPLGSSTRYDLRYALLATINHSRLRVHDSRADLLHWLRDGEG